jgi:hypothetical protein
LCFIEVFDGEVTLDGASGIADAEEDGFPHVAEGDDAACGGDLETFGEMIFEVGGGGGGIEASAEGVDAELAEFGEFFAADGDEFCFGGLGLDVGIAHVGFGVEEREERSKCRLETRDQNPEARNQRCGLAIDWRGGERAWVCV